MSRHTRSRVAELQARRYRARERGDQQEVDRLGREIEAEQQAGRNQPRRYWQRRQRS